MAKKPVAPPTTDIDPDVVRKLLQHAPLTVNQTAVVARGPQVIAHRGALRQMEAADIAVHIATGWRDTGQTMRIQFLRLPLNSQSNILLTFPLGGDYRLTLVDKEDSPLDNLRRLGTQLISVLSAAGLGR